MAIDVESGVLSDLIGAIYDCAVDPSRWSRTLEAICAATGFATAVLSVQNLPDMRLVMFSSYGIAPEWLARMPQYAEAVRELWGGAEYIAQASMEDVHVATDLMPMETIESNPYVREWALPQGLKNSASLVLARSASLVGGLGLGWRAESGPIGEPPRQMCRLLLPHLQRATAISKLLDVQSLQAAGFVSTLNALRAGVVLLSRDLRVIFANRAGQDLLGPRKLADNSRGYFALPDPIAAAALEAAVQKAADDETSIGRRGMGIPVLARHGEAMVLHVLPLRHGELRPGLSPSAVAAVFISNPAQSTEAPFEGLAAMFDLTAAETRVFQLVAQGESREAVAARLDLALSTVKTHLVRIYAKTGASRAADLVKLASSLTLRL